MSVTAGSQPRPRRAPLLTSSPRRASSPARGGRADPRAEGSMLWTSPPLGSGPLAPRPRAKVTRGAFPPPRTPSTPRRSLSHAALPAARAAAPLSVPGPQRRPGARAWVALPREGGGEASGGAGLGAGARGAGPRGGPAHSPAAAAAAGCWRPPRRRPRRCAGARPPARASAGCA